MNVDEFLGEIYFVAYDNYYVTANSSGGAHLSHGVREITDEPGNWEIFQFAKAGDKYTLLKRHQYVSAEPSGVVITNRSDANDWEKFEINKIDDTKDGKGIIVSIKSHHGKYFCAEVSLPVVGGAIVANRSSVGQWEKFAMYQFVSQKPGFPVFGEIPSDVIIDDPV